jgi:hypothetical protein
MKRTRFAALFALLPGLLLIPAATSAQASASAGAARVTLSGSVGSLPAASGVVLVEAELALGRNTNPQHVATKLEDVVVVSEQISGGAFRIGVPDSATLRKAEHLGNGNVNFIVLVDSGSRSTWQNVPVPLTTSAAVGNVTADATATGKYVNLPRFHAFQPMSSALSRAIAQAGGVTAMALMTRQPEECNWNAYDSSIEDTTRIGEVHADTSVDLFFTYHVQADTELSVGYSSSPVGGFSADGSITATNSMGATGGFPANTGVIRYADGNMYYQRYMYIGGKFCPPQGYKLQLDHAVGDSFLGSQVPPANPYGGCKGIDPHGYAQMQARGLLINTM